ncbi:MAG: metallophosphoesterase [Promethearchaeota archaeon]
MRLAILSDIHYPYILTRATALSKRVKYRSSFYKSLEPAIRKLNPSEIVAFVINGDFAWDFSYLAPRPVIPKDFDIYNSHIYQLMAMRGWLNQAIPFLIVQGNHEFWMDTSIQAENGLATLNIPAYRNLLRDHYRLNSNHISTIIEKLEKTLGIDVSEVEKLPLGENMFFLKDNGIRLENSFLYGMGALREDLSMKDEGADYEEDILKFHTAVLQELHKETPLSIYLFSHVPPKNPPGFIKSLKNAQFSVKRIFWGHVHGATPRYVRYMKTQGPFICTLPEVNKFSMIFFDLNHSH